MLAARLVTPLVLSLAIGCGLSHVNVVDFDAGTKPPSGMELTVLQVRESSDGLEVELVLQNESEEVLTYRGYSLSQPIFSYQYLADVAWVRPVYAGCGTGIQDVSLGPGQRVSVNARAYASNRLQRLRIGIASATEKFIVWSPIIDPATGHAGVHRRQ